MAHKLPEAEISSRWEAFANFDPTGEGTIRWRDMARVIESLGETPSSIIRKLSERFDAEDERVTFEEFLTITVGPPWEARGPDPEQDLNEAMEEFDDGSGYVSLRDLVRIVHEHMEEGYDLTDSELVDIYRQALHVSLFQVPGGRLVQERMWKLFGEELADFRRGRKTESIDDAIAGGASSCARKGYDLFGRLRSAYRSPVQRFRQLWSQLGRRSVGSAAKKSRVGIDGKPAGETAHMMNVTVVDLGGKQLMVDAVASTWSVLALQQHIETVVGVPVHRQFLHLTGDDGFRHELCPDGTCLSTAGVVDNSTLLLVVVDEVKLNYKKFVSRLMDVDF